MNLLNQNPFVIDTPSSAVLTTEPLRIHTIRWIGGSVTSRAALTDRFGHPFWESLSSSPFDRDETRLKPVLIQGLRVPVLTRGILYIYY